MFHPKARNQRCIPVAVIPDTGTCEKTAPEIMSLIFQGNFVYLNMGMDYFFMPAAFSDDVVWFSGLYELQPAVIGVDADGAIVTPDDGGDGDGGLG